MSIWIIFIGFMILSWIVSMTLKSKFSKYSKIPLDNGMSGREVAEKMLQRQWYYRSNNWKC
jgi:Zn-dependent membrane protease YugP